MTGRGAFSAELSLASEIPFPGNGDRRRWRQVRIRYYGTIKRGALSLLRHGDPRRFLAVTWYAE
jgi:hypothetical protein